MEKIVVALLMVALAILAVEFASDIKLIQLQTTQSQAPATPPLMYAGIRG